MSCNGWKHLKNYRLNDDFCARNIEMRDASRKKNWKFTYMDMYRCQYAAIIDLKCR
jgi:hypothetical protein